MRKYLYLFVATLFVFSCAKEQENLVEKNEPIINPQTEVTSASIFPDVFTADEEEVKTSYDPDGVFSWVLNDEAAIYAVDNVTTPENQGWIAYQATVLANENKTATFTKVAGQTAKETAMASYTKTGIAVYPSSIASPSSGNTGATAYGAAFVTLPSSINGTASENVLIGTPDDAENPTTFSFRSAMAQMRVTVTGIPAQAASLRLYTNDQEHFPLAGNFVLTANKEITHEDYRKVGESHSGLAYLSIDLPGTEIASRDFFFSIPTGEYPANTLTLKMLDGDNNVLLEKTLSKIINFERNDLVRMSALANQWVTLGTGKFYDKFYTSYPDCTYADVIVQQNASNTNQYRICNPYGLFASANSVASDTPDPYFVFTVNNNKSVDFEDHRTGITKGAQVIVVKHPSKQLWNGNYAAAKDGGYNVVKTGTADAPQVIQFSTVYWYADGTNGFSNNSSYNNIAMLIFPGYDTSFELECNGLATATDLTIKVSGTNVSTVKIGANQYASTAITNMNSASAIDASTGLLIQNIKGNATGEYSRWIAVRAFNSDGAEIAMKKQSKILYSLSSADATAYARQFTGEYLYNTYEGENSSTNTITFAVSDKPFKGNIMITEFDGLSYDVSTNTHTRVYNPVNYNEYQDGNPIYGYFDGTTTYPNVTFSDALNQVFYTDNSGASHHLAGCYTIGTYSADLKFAFGSSSAYYRSKTYTIVCWDRYLVNYWKINASSGYDYYMWQYGANAN